MHKKLKAAVLGANGFIGSRLVETLVLTDLAEVRPIVRSYTGMVRAARFHVDCRIADGTDADALRTHLSGCDVLFNCVTGLGETIVKNIEAAYLGAVGAGVKRLVHLSSAVVHGNSPARGTNDESELLTDQPWDYNVNKALAEQSLRQLARDGRVETVVLRPLIVYGPRCPQWTAHIAGSLLAGQAYLLEGGAGVCNTVYVDNLVHAMLLAATVPGAANESFFITDGESVTWRELYQSIADALDLDLSSVVSLDRAVLDDIPRKIKDQPWKIAVRQAGHLVKQLTPPLAKTLAKRMVPRRLGAAMRNGWEVAHEVGVQQQSTDRTKLMPADLFVVQLQSCEYQLPIAKAERLLGYHPQMSFADGALKAGSWLRFALPPLRGEGVEVHATAQPRRRCDASTNPIA